LPCEEDNELLHLDDELLAGGLVRDLLETDLSPLILALKEHTHVGAKHAELVTRV